MNLLEMTKSNLIHFHKQLPRSHLPFLVASAQAQLSGRSRSFPSQDTSLCRHVRSRLCGSMYLGEHSGSAKRRASFIESDGSKGMAKHFTILQTDITTTLSIILALTRACGDAWCGAMCARAAFILLEKDGMRLGDLTWVLDWGLPASFTPRRISGHSHIVFITALVLLASLPALFAAPVLTGSITWSPSHTMVLSGVPVSNIPTSAGVHDSYSWWWLQFAANRDICRIRAAGSAGTAWNTDATLDLGLMKRIVAPAKQLSPNSTLNNITLPYFVVHSLTWLSDISQINQPNLT